MIIIGKNVIKLNYTIYISYISLVKYYKYKRNTKRNSDK